MMTSGLGMLMAHSEAPTLQSGDLAPWYTHPFFLNLATLRLQLASLRLQLPLQLTEQGSGLGGPCVGCHRATSAPCCCAGVTGCFC